MRNCTDLSVLITSWRQDLMTHTSSETLLIAYFAALVRNKKFKNCITDYLTIHSECHVPLPLNCQNMTNYVCWNCIIHLIRNTNMVQNISDIANCCISYSGLFSRGKISVNWARKKFSQIVTDCVEYPLKRNILREKLKSIRKICKIFPLENNLLYDM